MPVTFRISSGWRWWQELGKKICRGTSVDVVAPAAGFALVARGRRHHPLADRSLEPRTGNLRARFFGPGTRHAPVGRPNSLHGAAQQSHGCNIPELIPAKGLSSLIGENPPAEKIERRDGGNR